MIKKLVGLTAGLFFLSTTAHAATLVTPLAGGNSNNGVMFDIVSGANALTLQSLGISVDANSSSPATFEIYKIAGGVGGNQSNAAAWTLVGTFANVAFQPQGTPTVLDFADFGFAANSILGLYVTITNGDQGACCRVSYTNGSAVGNVIASDGNLSILTGYGKAYPFGGTFQPRNFNGQITYALGAVPEPATWAMMILGFGLIGGAMRYRKGKTTVAFA